MGGGEGGNLGSGVMCLTGFSRAPPQTAYAGLTVSLHREC